MLNERYAVVAAQLGHEDRSVRLAGVHGMAALADDWEEQRQTCINVLCAYLRMPYQKSALDEDIAASIQRRADHEVRHAIIGVIRTHLLKAAHSSWHGYDFDLTEVCFDGASFKDAEFANNNFLFRGAEFCADDGHTVTFEGATFSSGKVDFWGARFTGQKNIVFWDCDFAGADVSFREAEFTAPEVEFGGSKFREGTVKFDGAKFTEGQVTFRNATFSGSSVQFKPAELKPDATGGTQASKFVCFAGREFAFWDAEFQKGEIIFDRAHFDAGTVGFGGAKFKKGAHIEIKEPEFNGGELDLSEPKVFEEPPTIYGAPAKCQVYRKDGPPGTVSKVQPGLS